MVLHHNHWWWAKNELFCLCILDMTVWVTMDVWILSVPLSVEPAKPVAHPLFQEASPPTFSEVQIWLQCYVLEVGTWKLWLWYSQLLNLCCWLLYLPNYQAMNACPKANIPNFKDKLHEENLYLITEVIGALSYMYMEFDMRIMFFIWSMIGRRARAVTRVDFKHEGKQYPEKACCCFSA